MSYNIICPYYKRWRMGTSLEEIAIVSLSRRQSRVQSPESRVQSPGARVQSPESGVPVVATLWSIFPVPSGLRGLLLVSSSFRDGMGEWGLHGVRK